MCILVMCGGLTALITSGALRAGHRGWKTVSFEGFSIKMPKGSQTVEHDESGAGFASKELHAQRTESGSQYMLGVTHIPELPARSLSIRKILDNTHLVVSDRREVIRDGVNGIAGRVTAMKPLATGKLPIGSEIEIFQQGPYVIMACYMPYSLVEGHNPGKVRSNERELDRPEEFFASLRLRAER